MVQQRPEGGHRTYGIGPPGGGLPDATHLGAVHLQVSDLRQSIAFYQQVLGLHVHSATTETAVLGPLVDPHPFLRLQTRSGVVPARRGAFGLFHFAILLPERAALGRFATHLSAHGERVGMADHLVSESLYLSDPDGLGIEVYADRPRSSWQQRDRELVMTTDPLDVGNVIAASGGRPWDGMPPRTTIGHVHLNVGDLDQAEAFYHAALGFEKMVWNYPGALFLAAGGYHHHLGTNAWSFGPPATESEAQLLDWELVVPKPDDASAAAHRLRTAGYLTDETGGGCVARDPWGTRLRIVAAP